MKQICLSTDHPKIEEIQEKFKGQINPHEIFQVYESIHDKGEMGMTAQELRLLQEQSCPDMMDVLDVLLTHNMVLKTGVVGMRVIATDHAEPWILRTFKLLRQQRESTQQVKTQPKAYHLAADSVPDSSAGRRTTRRSSSTASKSTSAGRELTNYFSLHCIWLFCLL